VCVGGGNREEDGVGGPRFGRGERRGGGIRLEGEGWTALRRGGPRRPPEARWAELRAGKEGTEGSDSEERLNEGARGVGGEFGCVVGGEEGCWVVWRGLLNGGGGGGGIARRSRSCCVVPCFSTFELDDESVVPSPLLFSSSTSCSGLSASCIEGASGRGFFDSKINEGRPRS
jgi:hypothetical protein